MEISIGLAAARSGKGTDKKENVGGAKVASIVARLFADRTYAHNAHLKTSSYAEHKALNKFYDKIIDLADSLSEMAQGKFGKLTFPVGQVSTDLNNPADVLEMSLAATLQDAESCGSGALKNVVDEIEGLYLSTLYKLRELH